jgi:ATP-dependent DNA helicase RecG
VFGDLDVSTLRELPPGRSPITTHVVPVDEKPHFVDRAWQRVREEVAAGHQVYVVCPRIGDGGDDLADLADLGGPDSDAAGATVMATRDDLGEGPLSGLRLAVLHGRMSSESKDETMQQFASGSVDVLVSTTVIEVGVDVQNATVMVVVDADRFGVSQLHQLRGRVGRGGAAGLCLLFTRSEPGSPGRRRIDAVAATSDGFALAQLDLETRREGDVLGTSQSGGRSGLRLLRVAHHEKIIVTAREEAVAYVEQDPSLGGHARLAAAVAAAIEREGADFLEKA